jgi:hypothetical protein
MQVRAFKGFPHDFILSFPVSCSQFANEDAESQKFLTNGFLGKKKLADYADEHVSDRSAFRR